MNPRAEGEGTPPPSRSPGNLLSVVIPAYNNGPALDLTLGSLARQTLPTADFEVLVADDGSTPSLKPVVERYAGQLDIAHVRSDTNRGRAANRNLGADRARGDALLFLDADTVAHAELLARHHSFHAGRDGAPGVLVARRFEIDWAGADALRRGEPVPEAMVDGYRGDWRDVQLSAPHHRQDLFLAPWIYAYTHNISVDRATFARVGGFDEAMVGWGLEDMELFYRVFHANGADPDVFGYDEEALSYHLPHLRKWEIADWATNVKYVFRKHPRYDMELAMVPTGSGWGRRAGRIQQYTEAMRTCRREGLARAELLPARLRAELAGRCALVIGYGAAALPLGEGSHTIDHDAPATETNWHLAGLQLPFEPGQFDLVVNLDLWRFFLPEEFCALALEALRIGAESHLVATSTALDPVSLLPLPFIGDVGYVASLLGDHFETTVSTDGQLTDIAVRRA